MAIAINPGDEVFLDTSYALALSAPTDACHERAVALAQELEDSKSRLVTTRAVLLEIGNALSRLRYRSAAISLLRALEADSSVSIVPLTDTLYSRAFDMYASRADKEWGLIDCVSFVVMSERGLGKALTADEHFEQCGFKALLRES